ncbi:hypothetical protein PoB_007378000 [Plakobranchus ocellatus]|uniref:Uncharacterized protein n=1 Tax=Plakobranchus ocellatus TaxID=259542 RepID=A0AAV4DT01_9GAST|nr:hypothetical protein PoB_007378000 [Plakobranchus ocellatus]
MLILDQGQHQQQQRKIRTSIIVSMLFLEQGQHQQQQRKIETSPRIIVSMLFLEQRQHQQQQRKIGTIIFCFQCYSWRRDNTNSNNVRSGQLSFVSSVTPGEGTTPTATT